MSYVTLTNITRNQIIRDKDSKDELIQTLPLKTIAVLTQLAKKQGQVVSHDQLMNNVWHNRIVSPNSLQRCIVQLRKALGDDSKQQGIIKTHAKQGYSLELPVSLIIPSANQSTKNTIDSLELKSQSHDVSSDNVQISNHFNKSSQVHTHIKPKTQKSLKKGAILLVGLFLVIITVFKFLSPTPRNFDFNSLTPVTSSDNKEFYPSYSPDGKFIVFHRYDGLCANNIWAKEIATAREYQLTTGYGFYTNHSFTENGKKLAFMAKVVCEGKKVKNTCWNLMTIDFEQALKQKQQPTLTVSCEQGKLSDPVWLNNGNIVALNKQNQLWQIVKFMPGAPDYVPFYTSKDKNYYHLNYSAKLEKLIAIAINSNNDHVIDLIDQYGKLLSSHIIKFPEYLSIYKFIDPIIDPQKEQLLFSTGKRLFSLSFLGDVEQVGLLNHNNIANIKMNNNGNKIVAVQGSIDTDIAKINLISLQAADNNLTNKQNNQQRLAFNEVRQPYPSMVRSIAKDTDAQFQPKGNLIAFISTRSGINQIWIKNNDQLTQLTNFPIDTVISTFKWNQSGDSIILTANSALIKVSLDKTIERISVDYTVDNLYQWQENNDILMTIRQAGELRLVNYNLTTSVLTELVNSDIKWAALTNTGILIYQDTNNLFWKRVVNGKSQPKQLIQPIQPIQLKQLNSQVGSKRFILKNNSIYSVNKQAQLWQYDFNNQAFKIIGQLDPYTNFISDIRYPDILITQIITAKKEIVELKHSKY